MAIEFHCEHCNKVIRAPDEVGGQQGKCPHCGGVNYIPRATADEGELDLAPLDTEEEDRRRRAAMEDAAYQRRILHERNLPGEIGGGRRNRPDSAATPSPSLSSKQIASLVVRYVEAMSGGRLEEAGQIASKLSAVRSQALAMLDDMAGEDLSAYGLPTLPRPVLFGFLKQLRASL